MVYTHNEKNEKQEELMREQEKKTKSNSIA